MSRIEQLEAMEIVGNSHGDRDALALAHEIIIDESEPVEVRGRALQMLDRIMGEASPARSSEADIWREIHDYITACNG